VCQVSECHIWLCPHKLAVATMLNCIVISISVATYFTQSNGLKVRWFLFFFLWLFHADVMLLQCIQPYLCILRGKLNNNGNTFQHWKYAVWFISIFFEIRFCFIENKGSQEFFRIGPDGSRPQVFPHLSNLTVDVIYHFSFYILWKLLHAFNI
jgi:hypothetical protein